jgi:hypothetical protein
MSPEEFQFRDMILAWVFLSVPFAAAFGIGRLMEHFRTRDLKNRRDE